MGDGGDRDERQRHPELDEFAAVHVGDANNPLPEWGVLSRRRAAEIHLVRSGMRSPERNFRCALLPCSLSCSLPPSRRRRLRPPSSSIATPPASSSP